MSTAALQSQIERLDRIINRRLGEEEAELKRADASLEDARRAKMRDNAEARRLIVRPTMTPSGVRRDDARTCG